ncbi:MAG: PFL family protein [Oscillospiraceae bacterium]|nr:PFL family protein [Oscillospiraceae bacterium]MBR5260806.1 PFL family protein [Oscillospiraceae bacterium]
MINTGDILQTIDMISQQHLDVRTITMGISLRDCAHPDINVCCTKIYDKICRLAGNLVKTGEDISSELGVPIVNKRISVTPISIVADACEAQSFVPIAIALDKAAREVGVDFLGGFSALVQKGFTSGDLRLIESIPEAMASTNVVCSSVNVGTTRAGINMDAVAKMGKIIKSTADYTKESGGLGCAKLVVFCNAVEDNPFMAGAFHGVGEPECEINVGVSGPGVVSSALQELGGASFDQVAETIKRTAFRITRVGQLVAQEASARLGVPFGIVDLSLAPTPAIGDSVADILEEMGLESVGAPGTTAALALLNDAVKKGGVMASGHVGGLSGAFIPVSEDAGMIRAAKAGFLTLEKLEAMTCVCSVGLDMIAVPGDTTAETISGIIADEAAIGMVNNKTTAVRIIPAVGKKVGDIVDFGGLLGSAPVMPVNQCSPAEFIARGGRIPAPLHSLKN